MKKLVSWFLIAAMLFTVCIVSILAADFGDINCDGSIRSSDAVLLAQHLAKWSVDISAEGLEAADVFYDGTINSRDAVLLAQYLAKWQVQLGQGSGITPIPPTTDEADPGIGDNEIPADDFLS